MSFYVTERTQSTDLPYDHELTSNLHAQGNHWVLDSSPRQWAVRKRPDVGGIGALAALVNREECGEQPEEYQPLTEADHEGHRLYLEGVACSERGQIGDAMRLYKRAAQISESVAYFYSL